MICSVEGCENEVKSKGLCNRHWIRLRRHGSPTAGGTSKGDPIEFLNNLIGHAGNDCVTWPFAKDKVGGARIRWGGDNAPAYRLMCEMSHGPAPSKKHHATHTCGKGHEACVNPNHLEWGTAFKNQQDRVEHGTDNRGERCGTHKLKENDVVEIFSRLKAGEPHLSLANEFGVHTVTISDINTGRSWAWLTGLPNPRERDREGNLVHANDNSKQVAANDNEVRRAA